MTDSAGIPGVPDWPRTAPPPLAGAALRSAPEDFEVEEQLPFALSGQGEHVWLKIRKRGVNTDRVAQALARAAGVPRRAVGYAGMKDRHAVAVQWFSVPNYFGEQRFGRDSANVERARAMFAGEVIRDRHLRGLYLSAARAFLFNDVLARRVADGSWNTALDGESANAPSLARGPRLGPFGEAFILDGSRSYFLDDGTDAALPQRLAQGDTHPSGPLWGKGEPPTRGVARGLEEETAARYAELADGLAQAGLRQERRALRVFPREIAAGWLDAATLQLRFVLPPGSYATAVLRELADYRDVAAKV